MSPLTAPVNIQHDSSGHGGARSGHAWEEETLFFQAEDYLQDILKHIDAAKQSIIVETYIFDFDEVGKRLIQHLVKAQARGVKVRVLMDGVGSGSDGDRTAQALEHQGVPVKIYRPLPWQTYHYKRALTRGNLINKLLYFIRRINQRNHRKQLIIDNQLLWSGSLNISQKHLPIKLGGEGWQDYGVKVSGANVAIMAGQFDDVWFRRPIRLSRNLFGAYWDTLSQWSRKRRNQQLLHNINAARQRIYIVNAYFAPASKIIKALKQARNRGVDVQILVTARSDIKLFPLLTASYYADLLEAGIRVYEYQPGFLHAKALLIDQFALIGSTNFNHRSYLHDQELDIILSKAQSITALEQQFYRDQLASQEVLFNANKGWRWKILGHLPRLLRYWM
ncbi:phospholipase D-like domain-containing protein [Maricurvus nonylphenolicus]|uniref:phospholipase D-like domain-containing protein n=1 Tax=Maricurvus nonylphenolicus TaxID=1008307 RepID=UPI0036F2343B